MARFPLYTDADIKGALVDALILCGWDVLRAVDAFPEATLDDVHFEHAARLGRVLVAHDADHWRCGIRHSRHPAVSCLSRS